MTKEELRKEATSTVEWESTPMIDRPTFINGYIVGAEPREKRIKEYEAQIKKMKCCQNCMHYRHFTKDVTECAMSFVSAQNCRHNGFDKWEIKENDSTNR